MSLGYKELGNWRWSYIELIWGIIWYVLLVSPKHLIQFDENSLNLLREKMGTLEENGDWGGD